MKHIFSGFIEKNEGFNGPVHFNGPPKWTVDKQQQTEIFKIHHGLGLKNPHDLHVVATTATSLTIANVESVTADDFVISVWTLGQSPAMTDVSFVAVLH